MVGIFHDHQHETPMIYRWNGFDAFKPKAAFLGGFGVVRVTDIYMDLVFSEVVSDSGELKFTDAFSKP